MLRFGKKDFPTHPEPAQGGKISMSQARQPDQVSSSDPQSQKPSVTSLIIQRDTINREIIGLSRLMDEKKHEFDQINVQIQAAVLGVSSEAWK
jgi:hypothetical protein